MNGTTPSQPGCSPCAGFPGGSNCSTTQILDPTDEVLTATMSGAVDASMVEFGDLPLGIGQTEVDVTFLTPKAGDYRFEYLYVDNFGGVNPGTIQVVPVSQTSNGFTAEIAGMPPQAGYVLRWRVVVFQIAQPVPPPPPPDPTEVIYDQLPMDAAYTHFFQVPRTIQPYGFSELRIENLIDLPGDQVVIGVQVVWKDLDKFIVKLDPVPPDNNYFLSARTP